MPELAPVAGVDVGTTKVCAIIAQPHVDGRLEIMGVGLTPSAGLQRGIIVDRENAISCIREAVRLAQEQAGLEISSAYVGVTGAHISSVNVTGRTNVSPGPAISQEDVQRAVQSARDAVPLPQDREIIHEVVRGYTVDGESGVTRPVGMSGRRLDVELHAVTGTASIVENVERCVEDAGIHVAARVLEPIATGTAVITDAERDLGVILADIGGGTTDVAVFVDGAIAHTSAIPVGGNHVTRDISRLLRVSFDEAEKLKCRYASALPNGIDADETVQVSLADGDETEHVPLQLVAEIIEPRLEEVFTLVRNNVAAAGVARARRHAGACGQSTWVDGAGGRGHEPDLRNRRRPDASGGSGWPCGRRRDHKPAGFVRPSAPVVGADSASRVGCQGTIRGNLRRSETFDRASCLTSCGVTRRPPMQFAPAGPEGPNAQPLPRASEVFWRYYSGLAS